MGKALAKKVNLFNQTAIFERMKTSWFQQMLQDITKVIERLYVLLKQTNRKNTVIFLVCLGISTTMWLLLALSETYTAAVRVPVRFEQVPSDRVVVSSLLSEIEMDVQAPGFSLVSYRLFSSFNTLTINLADFRVAKEVTNVNIPASFIKNQLEGQLSTQDQLIAIHPDTISIKYSVKQYKKVPVVVKDSLSFRRQHFLANLVNVVPDSVVLYGPSLTLQQIDTLFTEQVMVSDVHETFSKSLKLMMADSIQQVSVDTTQVKATWEIDQYTEGKFVLPVISKGLEKSKSVKLFPDSVQVIFQVGLKSFDNLSRELFEVSADFSDSLTWKNRTKIRVSVTKQPDLVRHVRIQPNSVEYLFEE